MTDTFKWGRGLCPKIQIQTPPHNQGISKVPFKSKKQMRFLYAKKPKIAKEFASKTHSFKALPEKVGAKKPSSSAQALINKKRKK